MVVENDRLAFLNYIFKIQDCIVRSSFEEDVKRWQVSFIEKWLDLLEQDSPTTTEQRKEIIFYYKSLPEFSSTAWVELQIYFERWVKQMESHEK